MYVLHTRDDSAALAVRLVLEELGQPYETRLVSKEAGDPESPAYRALQPLGLVPALETPDGPMFETAAILLWLADRHKALAPAPDAADRGQFLKWFFFTVSHVHPIVLQLFYPERYKGEGNDEEAFTAGAAARVRIALGLLNDVAASGSLRWLSASEPSILTYYLALLIRWFKSFDESDVRHLDFNRWPALQSIAVAMEERPAAIRCAKAENLGPAPFSDPAY